MRNHITYLDCKQKPASLQLSMNFDVDSFISEDGKVRLVCTTVERMNLDAILGTYSSRGRKPALDPITFLQVILFCYSEGIFESRKIEKFCRYDLRGHYILKGKKAPDHSTICRYLAMLEPHCQDLLTNFVQLLLDENHVDLKSLYIDGTKIESTANRYTFVWRKSVEKHRKKLVDKMIQELGLPDGSTVEAVEACVQKRFHEAQNLCKKNQIVFVSGSGRRKTPEQRDYEHYQEVLDRLATYREHLRIMGTRSSYSKTDHDATFMRMKEDHMRNGQLKPAYNIQLASSGAFIVGVMGSSKTNDLHTLIPFLEQLKPAYGSAIQAIVADAGYESFDNYTYLEEKAWIPYIKPMNHEQKKTKKVKENLGLRENMTYLEDQDIYVCQAGKHLVRGKDQKRHTQFGYDDTLWVYTCQQCEGCPHAIKCIKSRNNTAPTRKTLKFSPVFDQQRKQSEANILSEAGVNQRINRSIQAEGAFAKMKDGVGYTRFRHRSMNKVVADMVLVALGLNLNKLHSKSLKNQTGIIEYQKTA